MDPIEIRDDLLRRLYVARFQAGEDLLVDGALIHERGWDRAKVQEILLDLSREGLVKLRDSGPHYRLKPAGASHVEEAGLAPADLVSACNKSRVAILDLYMRQHEGRYGGPHYREAIASVVQSTGLGETLVKMNHERLEGEGMIDEAGSVGYFSIAESGVEALTTWRRKMSIAETFEALASAEDPHVRGRSFQRLFGELAADAGWSILEGVKNTGEEIDLVLSRDGTFHLVECRWKAEPVEGKEMRDFIGKLDKRVGVHGVFASMSGYAKGAVDEAERILDRHPLILCGPVDLREVFAFRASLDDLFATKREAAIVRRKTPWE